jgi:hypothetical protein
MKTFYNRLYSMPALTKTIYHPHLITGYFLKLLPTDLLQQIPRSTQYDWNKKQKKNMFGNDWSDKNKELSIAC